MDKLIVHIVNWYFIQEIEDVYQAPELRKVKLQGNVLNHPGHDLGEFVTTSSLQEWDLSEGWAESRNTRYILIGEKSEMGKPSITFNDVAEYE